MAKIVYVADDGLEFPSTEECELHNHAHEDLDKILVEEPDAPAEVDTAMIKPTK